MNYIISHTPDDRMLAEQVLKGDHQAFAEIIRNTEALVARIVCNMVPGVEDRKDLAQDIYMKTFRSLSGFRFESKLSTWIAQIAYHTCISHLEKKKLVFPGNWLMEDGGDHDHLENLNSQSYASSKGSSDNLLLQKELRSILRWSMAELPPLYNTLITLFHQEEMSYEEIGQITGLPGGTVKSYLFRARKMLREYISKKYQKEEI